ncbi:solute carrier family 2, facilitated glucose transporter member 5-like [Tiliqua scincoides]|uniref:solute carrier family 2, facilitated glucose transporter member 5-like n=1 Tax=Tiliqua scincoides TaxID=71010 RepID=UPI003462BA5B
MLLLLTPPLESMETARSGPKKKLKQYFHNITTQVVEKSTRDAQMHPSLLIFTVASFLLGCLLGSLLFGPLADNFGRKGVLLINDVLSIVSTILLAVSKSVHSHGFYAFARFLIGMCTGIFSCAVQIYLGEVSPTNLRGSLGILHMFFISVGILISQALGGQELLGNPKGLPFLRSIPGVMSLFQLFLLLPFPESPRYLLIQKEDEEGARRALQKLRGQDDVEDEIEELREEDLYEKKEKKMTILKLLHSPRLRWQLICVVTLFATQQFSGVNAAYYYSDRIFMVLNTDENRVRYIMSATTFMLLFGQGLSVCKIDSWGRRPLLLSGFGICIISCVLLTMTLELQVAESRMAYVSSFLLLAFRTGNLIGPTSIPHLMVTELFLQSSRSSAFAIGGFVQWFLIFLIGFAYILVEKHIRAYSFLIFLPFSVAGFVYILKFVPETKRKTFLDIRKLLEIFLSRQYLNEQPSAKKKPQRH